LIRIVDILRKANGGDDPPDKKPASLPEAIKAPAVDKPAEVRISDLLKKNVLAKYSNEEIAELFAGILSSLKAILAESASTAAEKKAADLVALLGKIIDQMVLGNRELKRILRGDVKGNEQEKRPLIVALSAATLGIDAGYYKEKLTAVATAAIVYDLEVQQAASQQVLDDIRRAVGKVIEINDPELGKMLALAEISAGE